MKIDMKKERYNAPKMEATSFNAEQGYAASVSATSVTISMTGNTL